jgi:hypothetical protein
MLESLPHADGDSNWKQFIVFAWTADNEPSLFVAVNYGPSYGKCVVPLASPGTSLRLESLLTSGLTSGEQAKPQFELVERGLHLAFPAWGYGVYSG